MSQNKPQLKRSEVRWPDMDTMYTINPDGSRNFLHPADVKGRWQVRKDILWLVLILVYLGLPWLQVGGYPAVHFDIPGRAAYLFGHTFTNQDFYLSFFVFSGIGFAFFVVTSMFGRLWCGLACPQTVFLEGVFRKVERLIEGPRHKRIKLNQGPWTPGKILRKTLKHTAFVGISLFLAHAFVAYFIPAREFVGVVTSSPSEHWTAFLWVLFWTAMLYFDYSWFREQTCLIICPYGRLQSSLIDHDTVVVGYDKGRGEPRSKVNEDGGDCIDCHRCVQVCPTGVDIRNGLQMECVGCFNCIDACDDIMSRIGKPRGLIRYDSGRSLEGGSRKIVRGRVFLYAALGLLGLAVAGTALSKRSDFEAKALRTKGFPYQLEQDRIQNLLNLRIQNKLSEPRTYFVQADTTNVPDGVRLSFVIPQPKIRVEALEQAVTPVFVYTDRATYQETFGISFSVVDSVSGKAQQIKARFIGP